MKSTKSGNSDVDSELGPERPSSGGKLGPFAARLQAAIADENVSAFARKAAISEGSIRHYLKGLSEPTLGAFVRLGEAAGVDLKWLATGEGEMKPGAEPRPAFTGPVRVEDLPREELKMFLDEWWAQATPDQRAWLRESLRRAIPEFIEWEKKRAQQVKDEKSTA